MSLETLRLDAEWWLLNSKGAVKIVLLIVYLGKERKDLQLRNGKWIQPPPEKALLLIYQK